MYSKSSSTRPRRAASSKPSTPVTAACSIVSGKMIAVGKTAAVAATSGVILTGGLPASADTLDIEHSTNSVTVTHSLKSEIYHAPEVQEPVLNPNSDNIPYDRAVSSPITTDTVSIPAASVADNSLASNSPSIVEANKKSTTITSTAPTAPTSGIIGIAQSGLGVPYISGGTTPSGWDCSGYVQWVFKQAGIDLPRTSWGMASFGTSVSKSEAKAGDLVVSLGGSHIAIYDGNGGVYEASIPGQPTKHQAIWSSDAYFVSVVR